MAVISLSSAEVLVLGPCSSLLDLACSLRLDQRRQGFSKVHFHMKTSYLNENGFVEVKTWDHDTKMVPHSSILLGGVVAAYLGLSFYRGFVFSWLVGVCYERITGFMFSEPRPGNTGEDKQAQASL